MERIKRLVNRSDQISSFVKETNVSTESPLPSRSPSREKETSSPSEPPAQDELDYVTGFKLYIVLAAVSLIAFLMLLDTSIVATALPRITSDFHSLDDVGWYGSAYLIASASLQPLTGKLYSYLNTKWTFLFFVGIFELGSLICGVSPSSKVFIVGRAVAGMGASGIMNGGLTILAACLPLHKRPMYLGILMSFAQLGVVVGPLIGGALTEYATWRWCFYLNLPCGGAVAVLLLLIAIPSRVPKMERKSRFKIVLKKLDLFGFALFAPASIQCLLALEWGGIRYPWDSATIIGLFCGAAGTLLVFGLWEWHVGEEAMIPLSAIRQRIVWSSCLVMLFFYGSMMIVIYYLPIYFQAVKGVSPTLSGVYMLPTIISQIIFSIISGILVGRLGYYLPWIIGSGALMSIGNGLLTLFTPSTSTGKWIGYQIVTGAGRGCGLQMPIVAIQNTLPPQLISIGMALVVFTQTFGGALFLAVGETDFTASLIKALAQYAPDVTSHTVLEAGATGIRKTVSKEDLFGVILAYNHGIRNVFFLGVGGAIGVFLASWGMGWKSIKKQKPPTSPKLSSTDEPAKEEV